jgi:hypothetical protein
MCRITKRERIVIPIRKSIIGTACFFLAATSSSLFAEDARKDGYKVVRYFTKDIGKDGKKYFRGDFRKDGFYSALAVSTVPGETEYGYSTGNSDQNLARTQALQWCEHTLKRYGSKGPCKLYAEIIPSGKRPAVTIGKYKLSQKASASYVSFQNHTGNPYKVFAFSGSGAWSWKTSDTSLADAKKKSLSSCNAFAVDPGKSVSKHTKCRIAN